MSGTDLKTIVIEHFFNYVEIRSKYIRQLVENVLLSIVKTEGTEELDFHLVREGQTHTGEAGEVTEDGEITLDTDQLKNYDDEVVMAIIAHEFAHFFLGHFSRSPSGLEDEYEADNLARKWGFNIEKFREECGPPTIK